MSGPILDRIDLYIDVEEVQHDRLLENAQEEQSEAIRKRVEAARARQHERYQSSLKTNAVMSNADVKKHAHLSKESAALLNQAAEKLGISARAYMRLIKVARTIADIEGDQQIGSAHISEALQYRRPANPITP